MAVCTFFGHRDCPDSIKLTLQSQIEDLITNHGVDLFYVGNQGQFDALVRRVLKELTGKYPHINYAVVLAYMPREGAEPADYADTMLPEGIEKVPPRFAIAWRNKWLLSQSEYIVAYVTHSWGGAAQFVEKAKKQRKTVINLGEGADRL